MATVAEAGGIVFRRDSGQRRFLLVTATANPNHWIFPKGHIEEGETPVEAAVREVREEAGVETAPVAPVGTAEFFYKGQTIQVEYFLLRYSSSASGGEHRESRWCTLEDANNLLSFENTRNILNRAAAILESYEDH